MPFLPTPVPLSDVVVDVTPPADRLNSVRRLCLAFALFAMVGISATLKFRGALPIGLRLDAAIAGVVLGALWFEGYRRRRFRAVLLPVEVAALLLFLHGMHDAAGVLATCYLGLQYRALFGSRRAVVVVAGGYIAAFVAGLAFVEPGWSFVTPVTAQQVAGLAFCAYLLSTLASALSTDRKGTRALEQSRDRYRLLFDNNPWSMCVFDPETLDILDVNEAAVRQYGYTKKEFRRLNLRDIRPVEDRAALPGRIARIRSGDRHATHLARHLKRDGTVFEVEITGEDIEFDGRVACLAVAVDVSERERTQLDLRESEQRFRSVAENLHEALVITDQRERITYANPQLAQVLGFKPGELLGRDFIELVAPDERAAVAARVSQRLSGVSERYETSMQRKDGSRISADISASPYRDAAGTIIGTLAVISDVTERKQLEDQLRQAHRLEAVGRLAGGIAHDFNNLLTVIKCHTELLVAENGHDPHTREALVEVDRAADRATVLTRQLLAFSRRQLLQPRRVVLTDVVARAEPLLRRLLRPGVELVTQHRGGSDPVWVDTLQLEHVLVVLVENAGDASEDRGRIVIDTQATDVSEHDALSSGLTVPPGAYAVLTVSDSGVGMDDDVLQYIFEPFFTTKGAARRTGMGLASVYGIVKQSAGFIDVNSEPGVGTTFRIFLPLATEHEGLPSRGPTALQTA
jgi:two-component system cell cycle sensor histidine kinase/response regulator CckA